MLIEENENESNDSGNEDDEGEGEEWEGFAEPPAVDYEAEYIDEDKYTTVTVEEMDPSREGLLKYGKQDDKSDQDEDKKAQQTPEDANSNAPKKRPQTDKPKKKKKKFRYESKEERKLNQAKQRYTKARKARGRRGEE